MSLKHTIEERFLRYVKIDTQADPFSQSTPSTEKQKNLAKILVEELHEMGIANAFMNEYGYVYATIPSNSAKEIEGIFFCAHMDTAPDVTAENVKPLVHRNYQGESIVLPDDHSQIVSPTAYPKLLNKIGHDIVTASGLTLLGSDDKSGVAAIMDAMYQLMLLGDELEHGDVSVLFTTDEEIGRGVKHVDPKLIPASFGFTLDGGDIGDYAEQTFSADSAKLVIKGVSAHPGYAKGKMEHSMKIASEIIASLPKDQLSPESTSDLEGFIHPTHIEGGLEKTEVSFILRDFNTSKLKEKMDVLQETAEKVIKNYPHSRYELTGNKQYRNMYEIVKEHSHITEMALEAMRMDSITPKPKAIRGGTDGSNLSYMGLPCPNIFAGEQAIHSKHEWCSIQDMEAASRVILNIVRLNAKRF